MYFQPKKNEIDWWLEAMTRVNWVPDILKLISIIGQPVTMKKRVSFHDCRNQAKNMCAMKLQFQKQRNLNMAWPLTCINSQKKKITAKNEMSYDAIKWWCHIHSSQGVFCCFFLRTLRRGHHWSCSQRKPLPAASRPCQVEDLASLFVGQNGWLCFCISGCCWIVCEWIVTLYFYWMEQHFIHPWHETYYIYTYSIHDSIDHQIVKS